VLGKDGQKLGKRNGVASVNWYRDEGFLPEAMCNYLALLGWSPGEDRESFTLAEMAAEFDLARVNKNAAQFDVRKLESMNGDKIRALEPADFVARITPFLQRAGLVADPPAAAQERLVAAAAPLMQTRISRLTEAAGLLEFLLLSDDDFTVDPDDAAKALTADSGRVLKAAEAALADAEPWTAEAIEAALKHALLEDGLGLKPRPALAPVRVAVTGRRVALPLYESIELLGRERTLARLEHAISLSAAAASS
jgi:glutamyl-tRNA synthetase